MLPIGSTVTPFGTRGGRVFRIGRGIRNEGGNLAVLQTPDADATLPAGVVTEAFVLAGLGVGNVDGVVPVDPDAAGPAELGELFQEIPVEVEDLDTVVTAIAYEEPSFR